MFGVAYFVWHLELHLDYGVQSRTSRLEFRAIISYLLQYSKPSSFSVRHSKPCFWFGVQSYIFSVWALRATISCSLGIQSHHLFSVQFGRTKPPFLLSLGVQSHHLLSLGVQSRYLFSIQFGHSESHLLSLGVQSNHLFLILAFRATISYQLLYSKPSSFSV